MGYDIWNHYQIEYTATAISLYLNGNLIDTIEGTFNPCSYFRFANAGGCGAANYLNNVRVLTNLVQNNSTPYLTVLDAGERPAYQ